MRASSNPLSIDRPLEEVFAYISNPANMGTWVSGVTDPVAITSGPPQEGMEFATKYHYNGVHEITYIVTDFERPYRYGIKATSGPFPFESLIVLEADGNGTRITNTIYAGADGWITSIMFKTMGPILRKMMTKRQDKELIVLKALLEADASA
ncbi:hypothetical protein CIG75_03790 [Tumebacillus algifaecis]|uniref:Polyketide cyclase n=1 Tax=Tumebacillus algifaecis TaxID=1214604 RepID=A0A223CXZ7_9BACL|nr:SRPBCC family protein [Tumebacillus algifaecis]ASS74192.1 hypothetical protein CIG75_03790 [Tumebacillus algifaecis]